MLHLGCQPHVTHGVLATYDKDTFRSQHYCVVKITFELQLLKFRKTCLYPKEAFIICSKTYDSKKWI